MRASGLSNPTVAAIMDAYLAEKKNPLAYRRCKHPDSPRSHLLAPRTLWGEMAIENFRKGSKGRVKAAVQEWLASGLSISTCRKRVTIMRAAFRFAISEEMIEREQEPVFDLPPAPAPRERFVDPVSELPTLLKAADHPRTKDHTRTALLVLLLTGVRRGALRDLTWDLVDFDKRVIRFRDTEAPDERSKKRRVNQPMDDVLFELLRQAKERATCSYVIEWHGKQVKNAYAGLKRLFERAGMPDLRVHDLRRSSATFVYRGLGGDLSKAANHIGDTEKMAESVYIQKNAEANLPGIKAVSRVLSQARNARNGQA